MLSTGASDNASDASSHHGGHHRENSSGGGLAGNINMNQIVDYLKEQQRQAYSKETEWLFEKTQMQTKINQVEAQLKAQENINGDLIKRIKMLEFSLRQERIKYAKLATSNPSLNSDVMTNVLQKANLNANLYDKIAKRRAKAQRPLLLKFLQEIGYEDIFNSSEISEIKALYEKAQEELKENINNPNSLEEKLLMDESLQKELRDHNEFEEEEKHQILDSNHLLHSDSANRSGAVSRGLSVKYELKSHMDSVRGIHFIQSLDCLASASEDCTVKLWSVKGLSSTFEDQYEPYISLRGHTGPLFAITGATRGDPIGANNERIIYTAGSEGTIRVWNLPALSEVNPNGDTYDGKNYCVGIWNQHGGEPIWDLKHHPFSLALLSAGANDQIILWNCQDVNSRIDDNSSQVPGKMLNHYEIQTSKTSGISDTPTSLSWLHNVSSQFAAGFKSATLAVFDHSQQTALSTLSLQNDKAKPTLGQINRIQAHQNSQVVAVGQESGVLSFVDTKSMKALKQIKAHQDGISALAYTNSGLNVITGSNDGTLNVWDVRNLDQASLSVETKAHSLKYDEGVCCITSHQNVPFFATGGADSVINVYELFV